MGYCGVLPEEQARRQPLEFDLDIEADLSAAAASDDLSDTLDYGELCQAIEELVAAGRFQLLERLASATADAVLADTRVEAVTVAVRKPRPPVPQDLASSGVQLRRERG